MGWLFGLIDFCAVYYGLQLMRCALFSILLSGLVLLLDRYCFSRAVFAKGILWSVFLLLPFLGRLKFFYENAYFIKSFWWLMQISVIYKWADRIYTAGVLIMLVRVMAKRFRLNREVMRLERSDAAGRSIYVTQLRVTPFTAGVLRPRIVIPQVMLEEYDAYEQEQVIEHELEHIRLGHMWTYLVWDILECLFWINPLMKVCRRKFHADMEDICDKVCIQKSCRPPHEYGELLLKSIRLLRGGCGNISSPVTYSGERDFGSVKMRIAKIAAFRSYRRGLAVSACCIVAAGIAASLIAVSNASYKRSSELDNIIVYEFNVDDSSAMALEDNSVWQKMITYDDDFLYVDREAFEDMLDKNEAKHEIFIVFGGFYKLPGIGGRGLSCMYDRDSAEVLSDGKTVRIPYEGYENEWLTKLFMIL